MVKSSTQVEFGRVRERGDVGVAPLNAERRHDVKISLRIGPDGCSPVQELLSRERRSRWRHFSSPGAKTPPPWVFRPPPVCPPTGAGEVMTPCSNLGHSPRVCRTIEQRCLRVGQAAEPTRPQDFIVPDRVELGCDRSHEPGRDMSEVAFAPRSSATPAVGTSDVDVVTDVVVVGGGGGGLPAALFSRWLGNDVVLLEKASRTGRHCPQGGLLVLGAEQRADARARASRTEEGFLRYVARLSRPQLVRPRRSRRSACRLGVRALPGIYAVGVRGHRDADRARRIVYRHCADVPDYWSELPRTTHRPAGSLCPLRHASRCPTAVRWPSGR